MNSLTNLRVLPYSSVRQNLYVFDLVLSYINEVVHVSEDFLDNHLELIIHNKHYRNFYEKVIPTGAVVGREQVTHQIFTS